MSRMHNAEISGMRGNLVNTARYLAFPFFYNHFFVGEGTPLLTFSG